MRHVIITWFLLVTLSVAQDSPDPTWLAIGPEAAREALAPLMAQRRGQGLAVRFVAIEDLPAGENLLASVRDAVRTAGPARFLLIIGDGAGTGDAWVVPPPKDGPIDADPLFGDLDGDRLPDVHVGRLPVRDAAELGSMVRKILRYENELPGGRWQGEAAFVTGEGHYGPLVDKMLERVFARVVSENIPGDVEVDVTYANPDSSFFWPPREFSKKVESRLEEGPLFFTYVGHGSTTSVDSIWADDGVHPVLDVGMAAGVETRRGGSIFTILACATADFTAQHQGVGEVLARRERGPVAFVGATVNSHPYGNAILGYELARSLFDRKQTRIGEALDAAKRNLFTREPTALRRFIALAASGFVESSEKQELLRRHSTMYALFGDPATVIRRPAADMTLKAPDSVAPGERLRISGFAPASEGAVEVALEMDRKRMKTRLPPLPERDAPEWAAAVRERHRLSNDKLIFSYESDMLDGRFLLTIPIPADLRPGIYTLKASLVADDGLHVVSRPLEIMPAKEP